MNGSGVAKYKPWTDDWNARRAAVNYGGADMARMADNYKRLAGMGFSHAECNVWAQHVMTLEQEAIVRLGGMRCPRLAQKMSMPVHDEITYSYERCGRVVLVTSPGVAYCECKQGSLLFFEDLIPVDEWRRANAEDEIDE